MKQSTFLLLGARSMLDAAHARLTQAIRDDPETVGISDEDLLMLGNAVTLAQTMKPRSRAALRSWVNARTNGDEGWLVMRAIPNKDGGSDAEAHFYTHLPDAARKALD